MSAPLYTRPFNIEHARAGAPFCGTDGEAVRVIIWDRNHPTHPILAIEERGDQEAVAFSRDGHAIHGEPWLVRDLVMTPLGMIDGTPVFVGDELVDPSGATFTVAPKFHGHLAGCTWPAPAPVYPETRMIFDDIMDAIDAAGNRCGTEDQTRAVANAALRHAVDSGQVMLPGGQMDDKTILKAFRDQLSKVGICTSITIENCLIDAVKSLLVTEPEVEQLKADLASTSNNLGIAERVLESIGYRQSPVDGEWKPPVGQPPKFDGFLGIVNVGRAYGDKAMLEYLSKLIDAPLATPERDMAVAEAVRDAAMNVIKNSVMGSIARRGVKTLPLAVIIAGATGQPSATSDPYRAAANAMRQACSDVLEQFNDRHMVKRSDVVAAARLVMEHIDVNKVLAGVAK